MNKTPASGLPRALLYIIPACVGQIFGCGLSNSLGVYYLSLLQEFEESNGLTSCVTSLNLGICCCSGPLASMIINKYGYHGTLIASGLLTLVGYTGSALATNVYTVILTCGFIAGVGSGFSFAACTMLPSTKIKKWKTLAVGVVLGGVGVGSFIHPYLIKLLIDTFGWRGAIAITGAITANTCVIAMLIRIAEKEDARSDYSHNNTIKTFNSHNNDTDKNRNKFDSLVIVATSAGKLELSDSNFSNVLVSEKHTYQGTKQVFDSEYKAKGNPLLTFRFAMLFLSTVLFCFGLSGLFTHLVAFSESNGLSSNEAIFVISLFGICSIFGKILLGALSHHPVINVTGLFITCYVLEGIGAFLYTLCHTFVPMLLIIAVMGFLSGAYGPLLSYMVVKISSVDQFPVAYGVIMVSMGIGTVLGAPSVGWLYDVTAVYKTSFNLVGAAFVTSGLVFILPSLGEYLLRRCH